MRESGGKCWDIHEPEEQPKLLHVYVLTLGVFWSLCTEDLHYKYLTDLVSLKLLSLKLWNRVLSCICNQWWIGDWSHAPYNWRYAPPTFCWVQTLSRDSNINEYIRHGNTPAACYMCEHQGEIMVMCRIRDPLGCTHIRVFWEKVWHNWT